MGRLKSSGSGEATLDTIGLSDDAMFKQGTIVQRPRIEGSKCLEQPDAWDRISITK